MMKHGRRPNGIRSTKISISVSTDDLKVLTRHAKREYGGNVSAVVHQLIAGLKRREAMDRLLKELGGDRVTEEAMQAIRDEVAGRVPPHRPRKTRSTA